jgi:chromate transporter
MSWGVGWAELQHALLGARGLGAADWLSLFGHFTALSLLAVGGALTTAPDMQRYVVGERQWLQAAEFNAGIALAQAAPGPNVIFVAVIGFQIAGLAGALATMAGTLLPSTVLTLVASRWGDRHSQHPALRSFTAGLMPISLAMLFATAVVLIRPALEAQGRTPWVAAALGLATVVLMLRTRCNPLVPIGLGAALGAAGWLG